MKTIVFGTQGRCAYGLVPAVLERVKAAGLAVTHLAGGSGWNGLDFGAVGVEGDDGAVTAAANALLDVSGVTCAWFVTRRMPYCQCWAEPGENLVLLTLPVEDRKELLGDKYAEGVGILQACDLPRHVTDQSTDAQEIGVVLMPREMFNAVCRRRGAVLHNHPLSWSEFDA